jgi:hypothetical protein
VARQTHEVQVEGRALVLQCERFNQRIAGGASRARSPQEPIGSWYDYGQGMRHKFHVGQLLDHERKNQQ